MHWTAIGRALDSVLQVICLYLSAHLSNCASPRQLSTRTRMKGQLNEGLLHTDVNIFQ